MISDFATYATLGGPPLAALATHHVTCRYGVGVDYWKTEDRAVRANVRRAARIRREWPAVAKHLKLVFENKLPTLGQRLAGNKPKPRIEVPRIIEWSADAYGVTIVVRTVPGVGIKEFTLKAPYLADYWRMQAVEVTSPEGEYGHVRLRAVHTDPVTLEIKAPVPDIPEDLTRYELGPNTFGDPVFLPLAQAALITLAGNPGTGKSAFIRTLVTKLAPSPLVQFIGANGKAPTSLIGDFRALAPRFSVLLGSSPADVYRVLKGIQAEMNRRYSIMYEERGEDDFWAAGGPIADMPLLFGIFDECQTWMGDEDIVNLFEDIAKKGRGAGIILLLATQKPTAESLPTRIRDVSTSALCCPVLTDTAAVAALGPEIREFPQMNPAAIMSPAYRGVVTIRDEQGGFTRFKSPFTETKLSAAVAQRTAVFVRDIPGISVGTEHRKANVPDSAAALFKSTPPPPDRRPRAGEKPAQDPKNDRTQG
ncbi:FtsK/SpoIIIE domain-containing protein [Nocardia sp. NPDC051750]|uniref:FtsK/SpoIIIE domain-containing protein n=1 Tax=Nocardia sp. NPDC051750 TaxID=3364325 RepID=UPI0037956EBC